MMRRAIQVRQRGTGRLFRRRGVGQTPSLTLPTCASLDTTQTIPQMVLVGGGSLAMLVGIVGALVSDQYKQDFLYAAAGGLAANIIGGIWAMSSATLQPNCTGPGLAELGSLSVNPDQTTEQGQQPAPTIVSPSQVMPTG